MHDGDPDQQTPAETVYDHFVRRRQPLATSPVTTARRRTGWAGTIVFSVIIVGLVLGLLILL